MPLSNLQYFKSNLTKLPKKFFIFGQLFYRCFKIVLIDLVGTAEPCGAGFWALQLLKTVQNHVFPLICKQNQWFSIVSFLVVQFADLGGPMQYAELKSPPNMVPLKKNIIYDDINR